MSPDRLAAWRKIVAVLTILFGLLSLMSGAAVLFSGEATTGPEGLHAGYVLWSNFLGSFAYGAAGLGLWFGKRWSALLSFVIAVVTLLVCAAFALRVAGGAPYDMATVEALAFRLFAWLVISLLAYRWVWRRPQAGAT